VFASALRSPEAIWRSWSRSESCVWRPDMVTFSEKSERPRTVIENTLSLSWRQNAPCPRYSLMPEKARTKRVEKQWATCAREFIRHEEADICAQHLDIESGRLFNCELCCATNVVCRKCDRGWKYCPGSICATIARCESLKRAGSIYRGTDQAKILHRQRQNRYRLRQTVERNVTHQSSPEQARSCKVSKCEINTFTCRQNPNPGPSIQRTDDGMPICSFCHRALATDFFRLSFIRRR
jgi:hypothetical protein